VILERHGGKGGVCDVLLYGPSAAMKRDGPMIEGGVGDYGKTSAGDKDGPDGCVCRCNARDRRSHVGSGRSRELAVRGRLDVQDILAGCAQGCQYY
jgi:hypothetical protein